MWGLGEGGRGATRFASLTSLVRLALVRVVPRMICVDATLGLEVSPFSGP